MAYSVFPTTIYLYSSNLTYTNSKNDFPMNRWIQCHEMPHKLEFYATLKRHKKETVIIGNGIVSLSLLCNGILNEIIIFISFVNCIIVIIPTLRIMFF